MSEVVERFVRYAKIDTQSELLSESYPSTKKQFDLAHLLVDELKTIGAEDVEMDEYGYVTASIPANAEGEVPVIGFISHIDTSPDMSGTGVDPQFIEDYDGEDIVLDAEKKVVLSPKDFPELKNYVGKTLITSDGTTLLGADDKAGVAEIMTAANYLLSHPEIKHGRIRIGFTPDEEVGRGTDHFNVEEFGADYAYTVDGGQLGELEYENFNAAMARVFIQGKNVHPGSAKNKMRNAILIGVELNEMLPVNERPEYTTGYEGFFHIMKFSGSVEQAETWYIIRDHDLEKFNQKKELFQKAVQFLNDRYGEGTIMLEMKDQYFNMKEKIVPVMHTIEIAKQAMQDVGVKPLIKPIRGGTDGARLSFMGLPTPNLFAGGHNFHGKYEYVPVESMEKAVEVILRIMELTATYQK